MINSSLLDILQIGFGAGFAVITASIIYGVRGLPVLYSGATGLVARLIIVYFAILYGGYWGTVCASIVISLSAQIGSRLFKAPVSIFLIPCIYPLVPGATLYRMITAFLVGNINKGTNFLVQALIASGSIALGFVITETIVRVCIEGSKKWKRCI